MNKNTLTVKVNGKSICQYAISGYLYNGDDAERLSDFAEKIEKATGYKLPIIENEKLSEYRGNYIFLDDTNTDFTNYSIKVEGGNIILFANYYSLNDCINAFFADILGYDLVSSAVIGADEVDVTEGKSYFVEKAKTYSKEKLMSVLEELYNDDSRIIIGQHMNQGIPIGEVFDVETKAFKEGCGVEAAMYGWDCVGTMIYPKNLRNIESGRVKIAYQMIEYMRDGGVITLSAHFPSPAEENPQPGASIKHLFPNRDADWQDLLTEGTDTNKRFRGYLTQLGDLLQIFKDNGAPIIFRPLFEQNGGWTWYGMLYKNDDGITCKYPAEYLKKTWYMMYDYLVKERGIDNLIWVFAPNVAKRATPEAYWVCPVMYAYPGDDYCDVVGVDWYPSKEALDNPIDIVYAHEDMTVPTGKIFVYGELSAGPDIRTIGDNYTFTADNYSNMLKDFASRGVKSAYALTWSSWNTADGRVKLTMYEMGHGKEFYANNPGYLDKAATKKLLYS